MVSRMDNSLTPHFIHTIPICYHIKQILKISTIPIPTTFTVDIQEKHKTSKRNFEQAYGLLESLLKHYFYHFLYGSTAYFSIYSGILIVIIQNGWDTYERTTSVHRNMQKGNEKRHVFIS